MLDSPHQYRARVGKRIESRSSASCLDIYPLYFSLVTMQGIVAKKVGDKNFGFIKREGEAKDLFFHANELKNISFEQLMEGDTVSFDINTESPKGPSAVNVNKV